MGARKSLTVGKSYTLKYTKSFCHALGGDGFKDFSKGMNQGDKLKGCIFVGIVELELGERQIFYRPNGGKRSYVMFSNENYKHVIKQEE